MAEIKNTFLKGKMNQDLDSRLLPNGEYREAINLQVSRSEGSTVGEFENMLGNTSIRNLNEDTAVIIGQYVNETTNNVYLFATDYNEVNGVRATLANCFIYELNLTTNIKTLLVQGLFLNFNQSFPVLGINLIEDLLFFTDNLNQPRKINISLANPGNIANPTHYTTEDQISVAKYAPCEPILVLERVTASIKGGDTGTDATVIEVSPVKDIKVGDIMSPFDTISPIPSPSTQFDKAIYVIAIGTPVSNSKITISRPVTLVDQFELVFQRPTMTNETDALLANGITTDVTALSGTGANADPLNFEYVVFTKATDSSPNVIIKPGDIVTSPGAATPITLADNITVISAIASFGATVNDQDFTKWTLTFNKLYIPSGQAATYWLAVNDIVNIGVNQNYDAAWKGDAAFLEDKFVRFSYRFKFEDNEYSLMAPFSQPMFMPKQFSEFGGGQNTGTVDMDDAYKSTILTWFENNVNNIILKSPMPYSTPALMNTNLLVTEIDLLYKESDALAVKVLDTVEMSSLSADDFKDIVWKDVLSGNNTEYYYPYDYASNKPYKTLPSNQTTRVYDKVPIKALAQELISNRVVYGNYVDKHSSPASLDFSALIDKKKSYDRNFVQYPYHNVKQNRTYQVGFVLSDRYGRQSDVILSSYDNLNNTSGSTIFSPYNSYNDQNSNPIIDWLGDTLKVRVDSIIGANTGSAFPGQPGLYVAQGEVSTITLATAGSSYTSNQTNVATAYNGTAGAGLGCTVDITRNGNSQVTSVVLNKAGSGYSSGDVLKIMLGNKDATFTINTLATPNPLGWYSYKVVVKQQQQEYYNVYLPGFVNGLPITQTDEEDKASFSVLLSDNINKVPRNLNEVGPTDTEYSSSELLYIRVNNPNINNAPIVRPYGYPRKTTPWNKQYFPGFVDQEVLSISTIRDTELAAIPFVASAPEGDYGQVGTSNTNPTSGTPSVATPVSIGSIPWGTSPITQPFYNSDLNPFAFKIDTTANGKVDQFGTIVPVVPGGVGATTTASNTGNSIYTMVPFLSVAETKPVFSLLEIFWETSLQGKINVLNGLINSQFAGISLSTISSNTFPESTPVATKLGDSIQFVTGGGTTVTDSALLTVTIDQVYRASDVQKTDNALDLFTITEQSGGLYDLKTGGAVTGENPFWYSLASDSVPSEDVYNIRFKVIYVPVSGGTSYTSYLPYVATLSNVAPSFVNTANPTGVTIASTTLKTYSGVNGSANNTDKTKQLFFDLDPSQANFSSITSQFAVTEAGVLSTTSALTEGQTYTVVIRLRDLEGNSNSLSKTTSAVFTVGVQHVPIAICNGSKNTAGANACGESYQALFTASTQSPITGFPLTVQAANGVNITFPEPSKSYNVRAVFNAQTNPVPNPLAATGALTQGVMNIIPTLSTNTTGVTIYHAIQYRATPSSDWVSAVDTSNTVMNARQLTASSGNPGTETKVFDVVGEYRVISTAISGEGCPLTGSQEANFYVNFGDSTYGTNDCAAGPQ